MKKGLSFYSADTDRFQDIRIKRLKKDKGSDGFAIYEYILTEIYRVEGCFLVWDENTSFDVSDYWKLEEIKVEEIVQYCADVGLFDKNLYYNTHILTSKAIQSRYLSMCLKARRKEISIPNEITLIKKEIKKMSEDSPKMYEDLFKTTSISNKVKKSKVNKSKEENNNSFLDRKESEPQVSPRVDFKKVIDLYHSNCPSYPRILKLSDNRKRKIEIRFLDEMKGDWALLESIFEKMEDSKFLRGDNSRGWKATFDWLFSNEKNWVKVAEGNYDNRIGNTTNNKEDYEKRREQEFLQHIAEKLSRSDQS